jgi:hypothetical protein
MSEDGLHGRLLLATCLILVSLGDIFPETSFELQWTTWQYTQMKRQAHNTERIFLLHSQTTVKQK